MDEVVVKSAGLLRSSENQMYGERSAQVLTRGFMLDPIILNARIPADRHLVDFGFYLGELSKYGLDCPPVQIRNWMWIGIKG